MFNRAFKYTLMLTIFTAIAGNSIAAENFQTLLRNLPKPWRVSKTIIVKPDQLAQINNKLNTNIARLINIIVTGNANQTIQVNIARCRNIQDAANVFQSMLAAHNSADDYVYCDGEKSVIEFVSQDLGLIKKFRSDLNISAMSSQPDSTAKSKASEEAKNTASKQIESQDPEFFLRENLPEGWVISSRFVSTPRQLTQINEKPQTQISRLVNIAISAGTDTLRINIADCRDETSTDKAFAALLAAHQGLEESVHRSGNTVIEFSCQNIMRIRQARKAMGFPAEKIVILDKLSASVIKNIPPGWNLIECEADDGYRSDDALKTFGITSSSKTVISVSNFEIRIFAYECNSLSNAKLLYDKKLSTSLSPLICRQEGNKVVKIACDNLQLAINTAFTLGIRPTPSSIDYEFSVELVPVSGGDYSQWNNLYLLLSNEASRSAIDSLADKFTISRSLALRSVGPEMKKPLYSISPKPKSQKEYSDAGITEYRFEPLPRKHGLGFVSVLARISVDDNFTTEAGAIDKIALTSATKFWPCDDPQLYALAREITSGCETDQQRIDAIIQWLAPGRNMQYDNGISGSRYGVKSFLAQGKGQCWDFSDCFITLCRALKIPARQIYGWIYCGNGHIWAECCTDGKTWRQYEPSGGGITDPSVFYIPLMTSETGDCSAVYMSFPDIELQSAK